jgi:hypothetical protein
MMGNLGSEVWELVQMWTPSEVYDHEREYQAELQEYLDRKLNESGGGGMGLGMGGGGSHAVSTERGTSYGDVVVDDTVGIELKRNFTNSQKKKLRGQIADYADSYSFVIACACGIEDTDGWRELEQKFSQRQRGPMDRTQFRFIIKRRDNFGSEDSGGNGGQGRGGGGGQTPPFVDEQPPVVDNDGPPFTGDDRQF